MTTKTASVFFGIAFIVVGILGFFPNPIIDDSGNAIFHADTIHNIVHLASGGLFLLVALARTGVTSSFMKGFGFIYFALGVWGLVKFGTSGTGELLGFLHVNRADNFLHIGLGLLVFIFSFIKTKPIKNNDVINRPF